MEYRFVLVIGGSGFIGRHVLAKMAAGDFRAIVPTRRVKHAEDLLGLSSVDAVVEADIHDDATLRRLMTGMDAVINLVGILHSRPSVGDAHWGPDFQRAHVDLPRRIVEACAATGVSRYLHMSALGAAADAPSMYLRSKAAGEAAAFSQPGLHVTVFRPSVVFGGEDHFLNMFAKMQKYLPVLPLAGADARFQPVWVQDVAEAFVQALQREHTIGATLELAGPSIYTLRELVRLAGEYSGHPRPIIGLPPALGRLQALMLELLPGPPLMDRDNLDSMKKDNVASVDRWPELGITPTALEAEAQFYLAPQAR
jgi:uncharacterized protein YbjT (DUF2867 family)